MNFVLITIQVELRRPQTYLPNRMKFKSYPETASRIFDFNTKSSHTFVDFYLVRSLNYLNNFQRPAPLCRTKIITDKHKYL